MSSHDEFITYLLELMHPLGDVHARAMFGGYGIYTGDLMFALVADDTLYFKTSDETRPRFDQLDLAPFDYHRDGKTITMSYSMAPADVLDDSEAMQYWAGLAIDAALASR